MDLRIFLKVSSINLSRLLPKIFELFSENSNQITNRGCFSSCTSTLLRDRGLQRREDPSKVEQERRLRLKTGISFFPFASAIPTGARIIESHHRSRVSPSRCAIGVRGTGCHPGFCRWLIVQPLFSSSLHRPPCPSSPFLSSGISRYLVSNDLVWGPCCS